MKLFQDALCSYSVIQNILVAICYHHLLAASALRCGVCESHCEMKRIFSCASAKEEKEQ